MSKFFFLFIGENLNLQFLVDEQSPFFISIKTEKFVEIVYKYITRALKYTRNPIHLLHFSNHKKTYKDLTY